MTPKSKLILTAALAAAVATLSSGGAALAQRRLDQPMWVAWPIRRAWDAAAEADFGRFVAAIGRAVRDHRCRTLSACLNDPRINPLYERAARPMRLRADCADVAYTLRAYFAYHHRLPFAMARALLGGGGRDARYRVHMRPVGLRTPSAYHTPREFFQSIASHVHSGFMRTAPEVETSDFYQAAIRPGAVRPGTVYYDPNGHVLMVYEIRPDGEVLMFDGHPGDSVTHSSLTRRHFLGTAVTGGGFKNFRPLAWVNGRIVQTPNARIPDFGGAAPFDRASYRVAGELVPFDVYVRVQLATLPTDGRPPAVAGRALLARGRRRAARDDGGASNAGGGAAASALRLR